MAKANIYNLTHDELAAQLKDWGQPRYRAEQVWEWLYRHKVATFDEMSNLPADLRERLAETFAIGALEIVAEQFSSDGETRKLLSRLPDGQLIESVIMRYDQRITACISTQAGCAMGCVFCATGQMGFARNLTAGEIVEQAIVVGRILETSEDRLNNVVLMGMGEPFHNYDQSLEAIRRLTDQKTLGIGQRHVTVSTVGIVPAIRQFADEGTQVHLAVSLHAATDASRDALIPVNKRWPLGELMDACRYYVEKTGRRIMFEWAVIAGENDTEDEAHALGSLLEGMLCIVNLIPLNPTKGYEGKPADRERIDQFRGVLLSYGVKSTVRTRRGIDIDAGCGQLKAKVEGK